MNVNFTAVLVASLIPMVIGALWYGPIFGKLWMSWMGFTEEELRASFNPVKTYGGSLLLSLVEAYVLAHILDAFSAGFDSAGLGAGMQAGFWCWLGFVVTTSWQAVAFEMRPLRVYALNMTYNLVSLVTMGILLSIWPA